MKNLFYAITLLCLMQYNIALADDIETHRFDSLKADLEKCVEDTSRANTLLRLALNNKYYDKPEKAIEFAKQALELEKHIGNKQRLAYMYRKIGNIYFERFSNYEKAQEYYLQSLNLYQSINDKNGIAGCYNNLGNLYTQKAEISKNENDYSTAIQYHLSALRLREESGEKSLIAQSCLNIGNLYFNQNNFINAIEYLHKSDAYFSETADLNGKLKSLLNLSETYFKLGNYNKALEYINKCKYLFETKFPKNDFGLPDFYRLIGQIYLQSKNYRLSSEYLQKALNSSRKYNLKEPEEKACFLLAQLYSEKKDYQKAYEYHVQYVALKDNLLNTETTRNMNLMKTLYETEKNEKEIGALKQEKEIKDLQIAQQNLLLKQRTIELIALVAVSLLILASSILFYNRFRIKQQELKYKAVIEAEEKERIRVAKDLHDGLGQMLSAVKLNVSRLEPANETSMELKTIFQNAIALIDDSCSEVRQISHNMMPNALIKLGLAASIKAFLDKIEQSHKIKIHFQVLNLNERLPNNVEIGLYRVIQETINNIIKHSHANEITLQLIRNRDNKVMFMIEDNGKGFDTKKIDNFNGIGLKNIYSRVSYLKGTVNIDSRIDKGTTITAEIPV